MAVERSEQRLKTGAFAVAIALADDDSIHIAPHGELDLASAPELGAQLDRFLTTGAARTVTLDLGELSFIDSTGIRVVVQARRDSEANGSTLRLLRGMPETLRTFEPPGSRTICSSRISSLAASTRILGTWTNPTSTRARRAGGPAPSSPARSGRAGGSWRR